MPEDLDGRVPAYEDRAFLSGESARPLRILAEYIEPRARFEAHGIIDTVVFFGSARLSETDPLGHYYAAARELARRLTLWSRGLDQPGRFVVCSGGGGGIMEAANRGASEAGGLSIGLNIGLPHEQRPNRHISEGLALEFHYFFMRKLWFSHLARAMIAFPGGFGTLDELLETLVLAQTGKIARPPLILVYGREYWRKVINFDALVEAGMIARTDLELFHFVDDVDTAFSLLSANLPIESEERPLAFARSSTSGSTLAP